MCCGEDSSSVRSFPSNQTDPEHLRKDGVRIDFQSELGTGVFVLPAPDLGALQLRKYFVDSLSYPEFLLRSQGCLASKWVPYSVLPRAQAEEAKRQTCETIRCEMSPWQCPDLCICIQWDFTNMGYDKPKYCF